MTWRERAGSLLSHGCEAACIDSFRTTILRFMPVKRMGWQGRYELLKTPRIQSVVREFQKRKESSNSAKSRTVLTSEHLDELFMQRLVNMTSDQTVRDLTIAKMFETAYKRAGTAEVKPGNLAQKAQIYAKRLYLPAWRAKVIAEQMRKDIEAGREPTGEVPVIGGDQ